MVEQVMWKWQDPERDAFRGKLPGGGPWRISARCKALLHNSRNAATKGIVELRCTCPRGRVLAERELVRGRLAAVTSRKLGVDRTTADGNPIFMAKEEMPDLSRGLCRTSWGFEIADEVLDTGRGNPMHREMCDACPVKKACLEWVLTFERPGGSWGRGMFGGMSQRDRAQRWNEKMADADGNIHRLLEK